jgi:hypothetical protein
MTGLFLFREESVNLCAEKARQRAALALTPCTAPTRNDSTYGGALKSFFISLVRTS